MPDSIIAYTIPEPRPVIFADPIATTSIGEWIYIHNDDSMQGNTECIWSLGDGTLVYGDELKHRYTVPGTYSIKQYLIYEEYGELQITANSFQLYVY